MPLHSGEQASQKRRKEKAKTAVSHPTTKPHPPADATRCHKLDSMGILAGHNSVVFKELVTGSVIMLQRVYEQHKLDLGFFFLLFCGRGHKGWGSRLDLGGLESKCDGVHSVKFPNKQ